MESEVENGFGRLFAEINQDVTHTAPKRLNFGVLNNSWEDTTVPFSKKSRLDDSANEKTANESKNSSGASSLGVGCNVPPSPWEVRRMKADYIEAESRIIKLKNEMDRKEKLHRESEAILKSQVEELKKQCDFSCKKVLDMEKHMEQLRKREKAARAEVFDLRTELKKQKMEHKEELEQLENEKFECEQSAKQYKMELTNELNDCKRHADSLQVELELKSNELDEINTLLQEFKARIANYDEIKNLYEKQTHELDVANSQLKQREDEIAGYNDWKEITKNAHQRLSHVAEVDAELRRLREKNKQLYDLIGNKLLLEEQVHDYKARLDKEEGAKVELATVQVKLQHCEKELKEWVQVAQDHCLPNMLVSPLALRTRIEELLNSSVNLTAEKNSCFGEAKIMESELQQSKQQCEIYAKNIEELSMALKRHKAFKERIQKKLLVVSKERDFYKQLLENYERDITVSNITTAEANNAEAHMRMRIDMLEKTLIGYKEMCANLEKEVNARENAAFNGNEPALSEKTVCAEAYENLKSKFDMLRNEHERLKRRKEELELELEKRFLITDNKIENYKLLCYADSPAQAAYEDANNFVEKLQAEIERLKRHIKKLETGNELTQMRLNESNNLTMNFKELNQLRVELESTNNQLKTIKEAYKHANKELRETCYLLLGYRIDRAPTGIFTLSSMFAESPDDFLTFKYNDLNTLDLLETPYSATLRPMIEKELNIHRSMPVFLSALTIELHQRSTLTMS